MKHLLLHLTQFLLILLFMNACKKDGGNAPDESAIPVISQAVVSNITANAFTLTWPAAVDEATAAENLMYKVVYSTSNNLADATSAEANGTVALAWTANALTVNLSSLSNSTSYYFAVLAKDADGNMGIASNSTVTLCTGKRMFLATASNGAFGGKTGGDALCNAQRPVGVGTSKAMVSDNTGVAGNGLPSVNGRQACYGDCRSTTLYVWDWVFAVNNRYCNSDFTKKIGDTESTFPILYTTEANTLSATPVTFFAGFNLQFGNSTTNCNNWSSTANSYVAGSTEGLFTGTDYSFLSTGNFPSCAMPASIVCVEQ